MNLPAPIQTFFAARFPQDGRTLVEAFAADAVVRDEGQSHRGSEQILHWWEASNAKYRHHAEPLEREDARGKTVIRARVSGSFPGSPAVLRFAFGLAGDRIAELEIG